MSDAPYLTDEAIAAIRRGDEPVKKRRNKYGVAPKEERTWCGQVYHSKAEMKRAQELHLCCYAVTTNDRVFEQPRFQLGPDWRYIADFLVVEDGEVWAEDVKGRETREFAKTLELWPKYGPCDLHVLTASRTGWDRKVVKGGNANWRAKQ